MNCQVERLKEVIEKSLDQPLFHLAVERYSDSGPPYLSNEHSNSSNYRSTDSSDDATNDIHHAASCIQTDDNNLVNFENINEDDLAESLNNVKDELVRVNAEKILNLQRSESGAQIYPGVFVRPVHNEIVPKENFDCVRYIHVAEIKSKFSIGIFVFPPHAKIPLHDHPGMAVLSRILYGSLSSTSYDIIPEENYQSNNNCKKRDHDMIDEMIENDEHIGADETFEDDNKTLNSSINSMQWSMSSLASFGWGSSSSNNYNKNFKNHATPTDGTDKSSNKTSHNLWLWNLIPNMQNNYRKKKKVQKAMPYGSLYVQKNETTTLCAPNVATLYPRKGNLHEFIAGENGAAVLDILLPPYDFEEDRDCTFYKEEQIGIEDTHMHDQNCNQAQHCWLVPIEQPKNFHCISGKLGSIGDVEDNDDVDVDDN